MILEPHSDVKMPMVRKPVHRIKPRVVTLQNSLRNSLERKRNLLEMNSHYTNQKRDVSKSALVFSGHEESFGKFCKHFL